ncbi:MAG: hypothetical protein IK105_05420 [Thermoguttaceae bacterium]|nr:hypothetical protein [Thermoguttaceae bacterium]
MTDKIPEETVSRNNPDDELLTAFLDGELSEAEKTETEKRLEADPRLRARLERLRAVDDFLNRLELLPTDREMTANTMEILTGVVQKEIRAAEARRRRFQFLFLLVVVLAAAGAFFLGTRVFRWRFSADDRDAPVISRYDALEAVGSLAFLKQLRAIPDFGGEDAGEEKSAESAPESDAPDGASAESGPPPAPRRRGRPGRFSEDRSLSLSAEINPDELFLKKILYANLPRKQRAKYRALYEEIAADPDAARLDETLIRFGNWFRYRLTETERSRYRAESDEGRLLLVRELLREKAARAAGPRGGSPGRFEGPGARGFSPRPPESVLADLKKDLPEELRDESLDVRSELREFAARYFEENRAGRPGPDRLFHGLIEQFVEAKGAAYFTDRLSEKGKAYMEARSDEEKNHLIARLIRIDLYSKEAERARFSFRGPRGGRRSAASESTADLAETLRGLSEETREELLSLPDDELYEVLLQIHRRRAAGGPPNRFSPGPPPQEGGRAE